MSATITAANGAGTTTPLTVLSPWQTSWQSRNIVHDLIGGGIAISLIPPRPRAGDMSLLYDDEDAAFACAELHRQDTSFTLAESDLSHVSMTYVVAGAVTIELDADSLTAWIVTIGYQETTPAP